MIKMCTRWLWDLLPWTIFLFLKFQVFVFVWIRRWMQTLLFDPDGWIVGGFDPFEVWGTVADGLGLLSWLQDCVKRWPRWTSALLFLHHDSFGRTLYPTIGWVIASPLIVLRRASPIQTRVTSASSWRHCRHLWLLFLFISRGYIWILLISRHLHTGLLESLVDRLLIKSWSGNFLLLNSIWDSLDWREARHEKLWIWLLLIISYFLFHRSTITILLLCLLSFRS